MTELFNYAVEQVEQSKCAFCRFITANDANLTSHQDGFYVPKSAQELLFDKPGEKGSNKDRFVKIRWQNDFETDSRFIYYGTGTRNEYRITRFGKSFPFIDEKYVGCLLIICQMEKDFYTGIVLEHDDDIEEFFTRFNLSIEKSNHFISKEIMASPADKLQEMLNEIVLNATQFPETHEMSLLASNAYDATYGISDKMVLANPDRILMHWIDTEFQLFHSFEEKLYKPIYTTPFPDCQSLIDFSNQILNRRKSRAGKSLEHHLSHIFTTAQLRFVEQAVTEDNKRPDFLFPGIKEYHNFEFPADDLTFLGAKTTCKDRWRQVLNEADRIETKFLFTLQPGVSTNQLKEMKHENLILVIPESNRSCFDKSFQDDLYSLNQFMGMVKEKQDRHYPAIMV